MPRMFWAQMLDLMTATGSRCNYLNIPALSLQFGEQGLGYFDG